MQTRLRNLTAWGLAATTTACIVAGLVYQQWAVLLAGAVAACYLLMGWAMSHRKHGRPVVGSTHHAKEAWAHPTRAEAAGDADDPAVLVENMFLQGRFSLLLRPQIAGNLSDENFQRALDVLSESMSLVPDGEVLVGRVDESTIEDAGMDLSDPALWGRVVRVDKFFLDRYTVTNRQFYEFVSAGGYQQPAYWEPTILPAVLDFVDQTGAPGPRHWRHGCFDPALDDHPVVGVCWYEAAAYARWVGKRLPTDAEWVKAGAWPMSLSAASSRGQRRYPWGDTMDRRKANLWGASLRGTVSAGAYPEGVSVGGVYQLIGNVWEWTRGNFSPPDSSDGKWLLDAPLKSIRGGAFDTYFDGQATCQFQSGESPMARKHNIGFRCAVGVCDLVLARSAERPPVDAGVSPEALVEVGV
jgi:gamma-glutamyl hercynylcysteine S-oxide synthase